MDFSLKDAIEQHRHLTSDTHRFWNYFQVIAVGAVAIAWQQELDLSLPLLRVLLVAFVVFAIASNVAVFVSQRQARQLAEAIRAYCDNRSAGIPAEFIPSIRGIESFHPAAVSAWHGLISVVAAVAMALKAFGCS